jgi:hypothetical protein
LVNATSFLLTSPQMGTSDSIGKSHVHFAPDFYAENSSDAVL